MMRFTSEFDKREFVAREAMKELKLKYPNIFKYQLFFTEGQYDVFDCYFFVTDKNGSIKKRVWIELKIRDTIYPDYLLEKKKLKSLHKMREGSFLLEKEVTFLYINFIPGETILWNITKIDPNVTKKLYANKATSNSRSYKVEKDVIFLKPEDGKQLDYNLDEFKIMRKQEKREKLIKQGVRKKGIFG